MVKSIRRTVLGAEGRSFEVQQAKSSASSAATVPARARSSRSSLGSPSRPKGRVEIRGRAASLLEVGTGFHPELTGRENIYLNGAILGMRRAEIDRKFDEIVAFAEIEKFLDTPVKRYSSGMYVRLAFAVAAHLEPEILIVDEVLAVGDAEFQKKCLGKMDDVGHRGRTVLFVSHNWRRCEISAREQSCCAMERLSLTVALTGLLELYLPGSALSFPARRSQWDLERRPKALVMITFEIRSVAIRTLIGIIPTSRSID